MEGKEYEKKKKRMHGEAFHRIEKYLDPDIILPSTPLFMGVQYPYIHTHSYILVQFH